MEGADEPAEVVAAKQAPDALAHLAGGLVGEGDGEDAPRGDAALADQVGDAVRDDAGLAGAGAGEDEQRAVTVGDRLDLGRIQAAQQGGGGPSRGRASFDGRGMLRWIQTGLQQGPF